MPIVAVHLVGGQHTREQHDRLLAELSARYAAVLDSPLERVRAMITLHGPHEWATAGVPAMAGSAPAPYFTALVLAGRPLEQRHRLLAEFTDIDVLGVDRGAVRGQIIRIDPDDWGIGGVPASTARRAEIAARPWVTPMITASGASAPRMARMSLRRRSCPPAHQVTSRVSRPRKK